jgi:hypothetical protein
VRSPIAAALALAVCWACGDSSSGRSEPGAQEPQASCATDVRDPVLPADMVEDLGTLQVGTEAAFTVPVGTSSFFIFSQEAENSAPDAVPVAGLGSIPNAVVPTDLVAPDDTLYYDDLAAWPTTTVSGVEYPDVTGVLAYDGGFRPVSSALPVPNTSGALGRVRAQGGVVPGTWRFRVNDWSRACPFSGCADGDTSGRYRVHVVKRPGPVPAGGTLDLEIYLATDASSELPDAATAAVHPQMARLLSSLGRFLGNAGVALGQVNFNDLPQEVKDRHAPGGAVDLGTRGPCSDLNQLFTSAIVPARAVHLFLADSLVAPAMQGGRISVAGVDGSIPGPSGFPGTIYGGAIVALDDFGFEASGGACAGDGAPRIDRCGTDQLAYVAAHEIGHWLGLYHTTEQGGELFDPVADTATCPCSACAPAVQRAACGETTLVTNGSCTGATAGCGGGQNLMFWLLGDGSTGELSADQAQIVRLNPVVR